MSFNKKDTKNLLFNQVSIDSSNNFSIEEIVPVFSNEDDDAKILSHYGNIGWISIKGSNYISIKNSKSGDVIIDCSINLNDAFNNTPFHFNEGQIGIDRDPLHNYKLDIKIPINTKMTALHLGDGVCGLSMGNATTFGFLPQIIGLGSDEDDAGLYLMGKVFEGDNNSIPAIILDARTINDESVKNRPILGISSGNYSEYKMIIEANGNVGIGKLPEEYKLNIAGNIKADDIIIRDDIEQISLKEEIKQLRDRLNTIEKLI